VTIFDTLRFAVRALYGHRLRTALSLLGVTIGVAAVILLTSLGEGARIYVTGEFASLGTNLIIVFPGKVETTGGAPIMGGVPNDLTLADAEAIRRLREVRRVAPLAMGEAPARFGTRQRDVTVIGTTPDFRMLRHMDLQSGRYLPAGEAGESQRVCVIGAELRQQLFAETNPLGEILRLGDERYRVIGVMAPRGMALGMDIDEVVHVPVRSGMKLFNRSGLFRIFIEVASHDRIAAAKKRILAEITERHHGVEDVTLTTQDALAETFGGILGVLTAALGGIASISLTVAGIGIMNVMLVAVSERTAEIGLLKALGAARVQILTVFLVEAAILSASGGALGLMLGLLANRTFVQLYPNFPVRPPLWAVAAAVALSILVGVVFGTLPARRAARLDPVRALAGS
jgi:putative ABC transport system permease protein